jgi:hypothetical protein
MGVGSNGISHAPKVRRKIALRTLNLITVEASSRSHSPSLLENLVPDEVLGQPQELSDHHETPGPIV